MKNTDEKKQKKTLDKKIRIVKVYVNDVGATWTYFTIIMCRTTGPLAIAIAMICVRFHLCQSIAFINTRMIDGIVNDMSGLLSIICYRTNGLIFLN